MFLYNTVTGCLPTSAHFSQLPDFDALLIGTRTGEVQVLNAETGAKVSFDAHVPSREPVMQARWRPLTSPRLSSVFAACDVSGAIHWWHVHSRRHLGSVELDDSLLSIDYSPEGMRHQTSWCPAAGIIAFSCGTFALVHRFAQYTGQRSALHRDWM
eukprot:GEMP01079887.1.p2 GENE.GEMP01079887.1~~GEMP01079887.1.p2  ORF type:complete len:156 (+),score=36.33 GEMP01079887.1:41-508(+)